VRIRNFGFLANRRRAKLCTLFSFARLNAQTEQTYQAAKTQVILGYAQNAVDR